MTATTSRKNAPSRNGNGHPRTDADYIDGKPVCDVEAEIGVLGSILIDPSRLDDVSGILRPDDFYDHRHQRLYEHFQNMPAEVIRDDLLRLHWLQEAADLDRCGGAIHLGEIISSVPVAAHARYYAGIVRKCAERRRLVESALAIAQAAHTGDTDLAALAAELRSSLPEAEKQPTEPPEFANLFDSAGLDSLDARPTFLVRDVLVSGQPCVVGGRSKTLKTSIMLDLAVSLASGKQFLDRFHVPEPVGLAVWSGESGIATIQETARRIAASKGLELKSLPILWGFNLPKLSRADHLDAMQEIIVKRELRVVIVDPLYLSLLSADATGKPSDVYFMGSILEPLGAIGRDTKCTICLLHHFRKGAGQQQGDDSEPCNLEDLSQAGIVEWARQWILLQRRAPYSGDGNHALWLRTGGSAGHAGLWALDVSEGTLDPETWSGRTWDVEVKAVQDVREETRKEREDRKLQRAAEREAEREAAATARVEADVRLVLDLLAAHPAGLTKTAIREFAAIRTERLGPAIAASLRNGHIVACDVPAVPPRKSPFPGYTLSCNQEHTEHTDA